MQKLISLEHIKKQNTINRGWNKAIISVLVFMLLSIFDLSAQSTDSNNIIPGEDIMITEIMINPQSVIDKFGEWIEIFNPSSDTIDIDGWGLHDLDSNNHIIDNNGPLLINPFSFLVLGPSADPLINGGVMPDYVYEGIVFDDLTDEIILATDVGLEIDFVEYSTVVNWPLSDGESIIFTGHPSSDNNDQSLWQLSTIRENNFIGITPDNASPGTNGLGQNLYLSSTWTGSGNWLEGNTPGNFNWSNGSPGHFSDIFIIGELQVYQDVACNSLVIEPYGNLTIDQYGSLHIEGDFIINSDNQARISGSFIDYGILEVNGNSEFHRHLTDSCWHFISSPLNPESGFVTGDIMPDTGSAYMISFNDGYEWGEYISAVDMEFEPMKGYSVWVTEPYTVNFTGEFNNGPVSYGASFEGNSFNFIGNPYPSTINWDASSGWTRNMISNNIWLWVPASGNYGIYSSDISGGVSTNQVTQYIPACQGFFIQTKGISPIIEIDNNVREHTPQVFLKNDNKEVNFLRLSVIGNNGRDEVIIRLIPNATNGVDDNTDIEKLDGSETAPQLYSICEDKKFSILSLPETTENKRIPLFLEPRNNDNFILNIEGVNSFSTDKTFILEDNIKNTFTELSDNFNYSYSGNTHDQNNRFTIHILESDQNISNSSLEIYSNDDYIYLISFIPLDGMVNIYNLMGQIILSASIKSSINKIDMKGKRGYYIVHFISDEITRTEKVYFN